MGALIDTSWLIGIERALSQDPLLASTMPPDPVVSAVTLAELRLGVELADDTHRASRQAFVDAILHSTPIAHFGVAEAIAYGAIAAYLRRTGQRIGERDLMIAATAVANGHSVVTHNRSEFERVPGVMLLDM